MKKEIVLNVNGAVTRVTVDPEKPLLWVLRDDLKLTGTKFGCGEGACGACSVLIDGEVYRSCTIAVGDVGDGDEIVTIEGLGSPGHLSPTADRIHGTHSFRLRLLHARHDRYRHRSSGIEPPANDRGDCVGDGCQSLPLRLPSQHHRGHPRCRVVRRHDGGIACPSPEGRFSKSSAAGWPTPSPSRAPATAGTVN